jgi:hypothetical protein
VSNLNIITTLTNSDAISGGVGGRANSGGAGVSNSGKIGTLSNGGSIAGGSGGASGGGGGAGVSNAGTITSLTNKGVVSGGNGGTGLLGGAGDVGVSNAGTITTLSNIRAMSGGNGGLGSEGGGGGDGILNSGTITTLSNSGAISGGAGGSITGGFDVGRNEGGEGVSNAGAITTLTNTGKIRGGAAGGGSGAAGGDGMSNAGMIATLSNSGAISGGSGARTGGAGVSNSGKIGALTNSGTIERGTGDAGVRPGSGGDAIYSAGPNASIGPITNTGQIIGNVVIDNQASAMVTGGSGKTFGSWKGGTITIGNGNLTFAGGNTALGDNISVHGGKGSVTNLGALMVSAPETIAGAFGTSGALDFGLTTGSYGALGVSGATSLGGGLGVDLLNGFTLAAGDSFDVMTFGSVGGNFGSFSLDNVACSKHATDVWSCSNLAGLYIDEVFASQSLALDVVSSGMESGLGRMDFLTHGAASSAAPEPSTWAMMLLGFLGLGGLGLRGRGRAAPS